MAEGHAPVVAPQRPRADHAGRRAQQRHARSRRALDSLSATDKAPLQNLPQGEYHLVVEAAREVGGREILRIPFQWPIRSAESLKVKVST